VGRSVHRAQRLLLASPLVLWIAVALWSVAILRPARARFARTSTLPEAVNLRLGWTFQWPLFLAFFTAALAAVGVALVVSRQRRTRALTALFVMCLFGLILWVFGQGALEIGPVGRWVSPVLIRVVTLGSGVLLASMGTVAFVVVSRKPEPLAPQYDRYTIGIGGLPFNRGGRPTPPAPGPGTDEG
jgi:hypothetical protein